MIRKGITVLLTLAISLLTLYLIQGACFRLVEPYAQLRLKLAWGDHRSLQANPLVSKLPLDHFAIPPDGEITKSTIDLECEKEFDYAEKIMSFSRPLRDRYYKSISKAENPLLGHEISDLGEVKEIVKPGLRRPANSEDVDLGLARREGLPVDYAKALFVKVVTGNSRTEYENTFGRWEKTFSFLLNHGIACLILNPTNGSELAAKLLFLQSHFPNFAKKIYLYSEGDTTQLVADAIEENEQFSLNCLILRNPKDASSWENKARYSWFLSIFDTYTNPEQSVKLSVLKRARQHRDAKFIYHSYLSGLVCENSEGPTLSMPSFAMAYLISCLNFFPEGEADFDLEDDNKQSIAPDSPNSSPVASLMVSTLDPPSLLPEPNFECEVIREYRELNAGDPSVESASNRELVISLGQSFEEMGENVLLQIAERDPLFYRFYLSLKEIEYSQN